MSQASHGITVSRFRNGKSYNGSLVTDKGDLYQQYNATSVKPDYSVADKQPVVTLICSVSGNAISIPPTIEIYWDNVRVSFSSLEEGMVNTASAGLAAGTIQIFQKGDAGQNKPWKLKFLKNIAVPSSTPLVGHSLMVKGVFPAGVCVAMKSFDLTPLVESGYAVHIEAGAADLYPFTVNQDNPGSQCSLVAVVYRGGDPVTATGSMPFKWFKKDASEATGWKPLSETSDTLIVTAQNVDAYAEYKVEVTINGEIYSDTESVRDTGDPYFITLEIKDQNGDEATPEMNGDVAANEKRIFKAGLASMSGATPPAVKSTNWMVMSVDGTLLNTWTANTNEHGVANSTYNTNTFTLPAAWLDSLNGGAGLQSVQLTVQINF